MTIVLSIGAFINFLVIILGVPYALWKERPSGSGGLIWWASVTLLVAVFALVSLVAALVNHLVPTSDRLSLTSVVCRFPPAVAVNFR